MIIRHKHFLHQCALHILKHTQNTIVVVPEKTHAAQIRHIIAQESDNITIEIPNIFTVEGLDITPLCIFEHTILSRNSVFAVLMQLTEKQKTIPPSEVPSFMRSLIGELPNLYAKGILPSDLIKRLPSTVSMQREINLNLCVAVWKEFIAYLEHNKQIPYYAKNTLMLKKLLEYVIKNDKNLLIVDDFGRSLILQQFITEASKLPKVCIFLHESSSKTQETYNVQSTHLIEEKNTSLLVRHLLSKNENAKIAIVCEDEQIQRNITTELMLQKIPCKCNISNPSESNPLVRAFLLMLQLNFIEIIPILKCENINKQEIINFVTEGKKCNITIWQAIVNIAYEGDIMRILLFIQDKSKHFNVSSQNIMHFFQFKRFLENELKAVQDLGISINKNLVLHISSSWKIFQETQQSSIVVCKLRDIHITPHWDAVILTSAYKLEPASNMIFSTGMRKYYGLNLQTSTEILLNNISCPIFLTTEIPELSGTLLFLTEKIPSFSNKQNEQLAMLQSEIPHTISATWLETLLINPLLFYYKHIKNLKEISYNKPDTIVGNIVHSALERATRKIINGDSFNYTDFILSVFKQNNLLHMATFYIENIIKVIESIPKNVTILPEESTSYVIKTPEREFIITARSDRIDIAKNSITVYDYKTGVNKNFANKIQKFEKIQLLIPACSSSLKERYGVYHFIANDEEVRLELRMELLEDFKNHIKDILSEYFIKRNTLECGKDFFGYYHVARI